MREDRTREVDPSKKRHRRKLAFLMVTGSLVIVFMVLFGYQFIEFTDSTAFCGVLCHEVMYPEYTVYQNSPHSRVSCAECHVGSGADYLVRSKLSGIPLVISTISGDYHRPISTPVENLRPARETCEECHRPEYFAGDLVINHTTYGIDELNTPKTDIRVLKVGGGESGAASGIHWHIAAEVYYLALDDERQNIAWVGVREPSGELTEYVNPAREDKINQEIIDSEQRLMDCMDCHNRATHIFQSPEELIDLALIQGKIDSQLPYIKREGLDALDPVNPSLAVADSKIEEIRTFYQTMYPEIARTRQAEIDKAIDQLGQIAILTTFPDMNINWNTYIDNSSHIESLGCFRCHGKLIATSGDSVGSAMVWECEACHYFELAE